MPVGVADLIHDAGVLHGLVDFIEEYCRERARSQTYVDASGLFFRYVEGLAAGVKQQLNREVDRATRFPGRLPVLRLNILTLKYYLRLLHALLKPAADAHTLTIPAPLIELASNQLQGVEGMRNSRIVVLLTREFMYFQRPHTHIKEQARLVEAFLPRASFPAKLGFIELPYSQGPSFFTNLAIYHEIGHFVYEELSSLNPPHANVAALKSDISRASRRTFRDPQVSALAAKIMESWTQEIFCDLFAIRLAGPAFSFALVEILGMLGFLSKQASVQFNPTHPASAYRFAEHVGMLSDDGWWTAIADVRPRQKRLLEDFAGTARTRYRFYLDDRRPGDPVLVDAFLDSVVPAIRKLVRRLTPDPSPAVKRFIKTRSSVEECLWAGVVPVTTTLGRPDPVSIINAAFCFYLTKLPALVRKFEAPGDRGDVAMHGLWMKRLEMWTMKSVEDSQIQARFRRMQRYGPF